MTTKLKESTDFKVGGRDLVETDAEEVIARGEILLKPVLVLLEVGELHQTQRPNAKGYNRGKGKARVWA